MTKSSYGGKRPGAGRKPGPPEKRKSTTTGVQLTPEQTQRITELAEKWGTSKSEVVRRAINLGLPHIEEEEATATPQAAPPSTPQENPT